MPQYPVSDQQGIIDGLNYVLSGPGGLGQNFAGYSAYLDSYLTGNYRAPFTYNTYQLTARGANAAYTIEVENAFYLTLGQHVSGKHIGTGAVITGIKNNVVTLSAANTGIVDSYTITFSPAAPAATYVAPISINNAQQLDSRTIKYTFTSAQPSPPFALGNGPFVTGITPSTYNSSNLKNAGYSIYQIGVIECTTTYVIVRTVAPISGSLGSYVGGGSINYSSMGSSLSTDCDARTLVQGGQDRVFISGQLDQTLSYTAVGTADITVYVDINRYSAWTNADPINPEFYFNFDKTLAEKVYTVTGLTGSGTMDIIETVISGVIDNPSPGFYRYILEVYFEDNSSAGNSIEVTQDRLGLRSISVQVIKP